MNTGEQSYIHEVHGVESSSATIKRPMIDNDEMPNAAHAALAMILIYVAATLAGAAYTLT